MHINQKRWYFSLWQMGLCIRRGMTKNTPWPFSNSRIAYLFLVYLVWSQLNWPHTILAIKEKGHRFGCDFGAALVSIRIQVGFGLDLKIIVSLELWGFDFGELLISVWIWIGLNQGWHIGLRQNLTDMPSLVRIWFWLCFGFRFGYPMYLKVYIYPIHFLG